MKTYFPKGDPVKALILERQIACKRTDAWMARQIQVSRQTYYRMIHERHTDEWPLKYIRRLYFVLNVTPERFALSLTDDRR